MKINIPVLLVVLIALQCLICTSANAGIVKMDLLGGLSGFEWSPAAAGSKDQVAVGWNRETWPHNPAGFYPVYRLTPYVFPGQGKSQYMAVSNPTNNSVGVFTQHEFCPQWASWPLKPGDQVTFALDNVKMDDFAGVQVRYKLCLSGVVGGDVYKAMIPSSTPFSTSITGTVAADSSYLRIYVMIDSDNTGEHQPGIYFDGAHFTASRNGEQLTEVVPVLHTNTIQAMKMNFKPDLDDVYNIASSYDKVHLSIDSLDYAEQLRYYNPDIKIYLYKWGGGVMDRRLNANTDDSTYSCPIGFTLAMIHDSDPTKEPWLYSFDPNNSEDEFYKRMIAAYTENPHTLTWQQVPYVFDFSYLENYFVHINLPDWQEAFRNQSISDLRRFHYDALFIDDVDVKTAEVLPPYGRAAWESQSFVHGVMPALKSANIDVMQNLCKRHLDNIDRFGEIGQINFAPSWMPNTAYPASAGYTNNTAATVADEFFQEWSFFWQRDVSGGTINQYDSSYWMRCLSDMDTVAKWNVNLPDSQKKSMYMDIYGVDSAQDPAGGINGWIHFGLTSYLLGQNSWTAIANMTSINLGMSITAKLGDAAGARGPFSKSAYGLAREYNGNNSGSLGGCVAVNGETVSSLQFKAASDFIDEQGSFVPYGAVVTLKPHTGRIFLNQNNYKYTSVITSPVEKSTISTNAYTVTGHVDLNRSGLKPPSTVQISIDNGPWKNVAVNSNGDFYTNWYGYMRGKHTIFSRVFISSSDYEPTKIGRTVFY